MSNMNEMRKKLARKTYGINELKVINKPDNNGIIDFNLMHLLSPNEFFIYTYLLNVESDFEPHYNKFVPLIGVKSPNTVKNIVNRLEALNLVKIEKVEDKNMWYVYYKKSMKTEYQVNIQEGLIKPIPRTLIDEIKKEISMYEEMLEVAEPKDVENILKKIIEKESELRDASKYKI